MNTFVAGWIAAFAFCIPVMCFIAHPSSKEEGRVEIRDQAVEKGYGEYVIEEKEIVFKWLENGSFREAK